jgi:hypothetical protein
VDTKPAISNEDARLIGTRLGINWAQIDLEEFRRWIEEELEHDAETNVTADDLALMEKVASARLTEFPDYFTLVHELEVERGRYWASRRRKRLPESSTKIVSPSNGA